MKQSTFQQPILEKIKVVIMPIIVASGYDLWGCVWCGVSSGRSVLRVYIEVPCDGDEQQQLQQNNLTDSKRAISLDDCCNISLEISAILDVEDFVKGSYNLEVSSPGLDRQLFTENQYRRFIGSMINVCLSVDGVIKGEKGNKIKNIKGRLQAVENAVITLMLDHKEIKNIPLAHIAKANIIPEF